MTLTTYPSPTDSSDLALLSLSRILTRLDHNLLSPDADLKSLRRSEYHRMRVGANIEYARTHLQALEHSLPQIKPVDRRHDIQSDLTRHRQVLKRLQNALDEAGLQATRTEQGQDLHTPLDTDDESESEYLGEEDLVGTPEEGSTTDEGSREEHTTHDANNDTPDKDLSETTTPLHPATVTTTATAPIATQSSITATGTGTGSGTPAEATAILRNRNHTTTADTPSSTTSSTATGTSFHAPSTISPQPADPTATPTSKARSTEQALASDRVEQENLTTSLLALATQLKTSSQVFQASLESEKSVLSRAVDGLDRTTGNMQAAERRMGMLRRMTEGKGWWGRMMLYAWIFGLWVVAVLIVFVGPKLRF